MHSIRTVLTLVVFLAATVARAQTAPPPDPLAELQANVASGVFVVLDDTRRSFAILGPATAALARGPLRPMPIDTRDTWVIESAELAASHPASLDRFHRARVRVASTSGLCETELARPVVVRIHSLGQIQFGLELRGERADSTAILDELDERADARLYVAAPIGRSCAGGRIATTRLDRPARVFARSDVPESERAPYAFAYRGTEAFRTLEEELFERSRGYREDGIDVRRFSFAGAPDLVFVNAGYSEGCAQSIDFPALFVGPPASLRTVATSVVSPNLVLDIDGDGTVEVIDDSGEWSRSIFVLTPGATTLDRIRTIAIGTSIGC